MLNDKRIVLSDRAGGVRRAGALETKGCGAKVGPQTTVLHRHGRSARGAGPGQGRSCGLKRMFASGVLAAALASLLPLHGAAAQEIPAAEAARDFDLPATDLAASIDALGRQGGVRIDYPPGLVAGRQARAVTGHMGWHAALDRLLQGSGLTYRQTGDRAVVIEAAGEGPTPADLAVRNGQAATDLAKVTVTGTRIRGGGAPSPVITIGSERIREEGFTDLGEVIRSVPQNFSGGQNPGVLMGNVAGAGLANQNVTGGSALNLRGLGPDASLTLLNGRRMAYGGFVQAVDISAIPVEAVERIEVVADGASAIYGSDAVGGVANVTLHRDFDGFTLGGRRGTTSQGGLATREFTVTTGGNWSTGGFIAAYKDASTDPIFARQRVYTTHLPDPSTIYPGSDLRSGVVSAYQQLGSVAELRVDALRTERAQDYYFYFGSTAFYNDIASDTMTMLVAPSLSLSLGNGWTFTLGGSWGQDERVLEQRRVTVATGVSAPFLYNCHCNESQAYELGVEGPLLSLPTGDARIAAGIGRRVNAYANRNYLTGTTTIENREGVGFAYAEVNLPLMAATGTRGQDRLALTAAVRGEDYDSFGLVTTPKLGLIYRPTGNMSAKASWGRSFKAPTLFQQKFGVTASLVNPNNFGGSGYADGDTLLIFTGGNPDLAPEHARTWATSLAFHPAALPGLEAELSWFSVDYTDRVVQPIPSYGDVLANPIYAEFVDRDATPERQAALLALAGAFGNSTGAPYDPARVVAIVDGRYVNASRQRIKGVDLSGSYRFDVAHGRLTLRGSASWLDSEQQTKGTPTPYPLAGTLHNPPRVSARFGTVWGWEGLSTSVFVNHVGGVTNPTGGSEGASFTTWDATVRYASGAPAGAWSGVEVAFAATNLFDRPPPRYMPSSPVYVPPYDSTNYSAIGRSLSLSLAKRW